MAVASLAKKNKVRYIENLKNKKKVTPLETSNWS